MNKNKRIVLLRRRRLLLIFIVLLSNIFIFYSLQNKVEIQICLLSIIFSNIVGVSIVVIIINNMIKHELEKDGTRKNGDKPIVNSSQKGAFKIIDHQENLRDSQ